MKAATTREQTACLLIAERFNATELAEALETSRQSALAIMRRIDQNRLRKRLCAGRIASTWMAVDSPTLQPTIGFGG